MSEDSLNGSEQFMLITGGIAAAGACLAMILQFILKSRCSRIRCCGVECDRQVLDISASDAELGNSRT
jgi:hypothetical protein